MSAFNQKFEAAQFRAPEPDVRSIFALPDMSAPFTSSRIDIDGTEHEYYVVEEEPEMPEPPMEEYEEDENGNMWRKY